MTDFDSSEMQARLQEIRDRLVEAAVEATQRAVDGILEDSQGMVPTDTGALRSTGRTAVVVEGDAVRGAVGYGAGLEPEHAQIPHEDRGAHHDDGGPGFLKRPLIAARAGVGADMAAYVRGQVS